MENNVQTALCPCGSSLQFAVCCAPLLSGEKQAATPLALMRSRYTAHVKKNMDYIKRTMRGRALKLFDAKATQDEWFDATTWQKLEIVDAKDNIVEFKAYYKFDGKDHILHERSKFEKFNSNWYYVSGQNKDPQIASSDKVGRNESCPCGSGKKFKKCCSLA